ncbi:MAG: peptide chain release factor N(5)-glutamine methyltransferase [Candidatus Eiseniibacteriota bacterium]
MSDSRVAPLPPTVTVVLEDAVRRLDAAGVETPRLDARLLVADALGCEPGALALRAGERLDAEGIARIEGLIARRVAREPVARIRGMREFWSLPFRVGPATLDPRPDSETLVEAALAAIGDRDAALDVVDLGTGTGCLLLALLTELPQARGLGIDISAEAVAVARDNAAALGLADRARFVEADWCDAARSWAGAAVGGVACILANPPYIPSEQIDDLAPEVARHEPRGALDGGIDGLDAYRSLGPAIRSLLAPAGVAVIEVGAGQADSVATLLATAGLSVVRRVGDLAGYDRALVVQLQRSPFGK